MDRLLRLGGGMPGLNQGPPPSDAPVVDTAEQVNEMFFNSDLYFSYTVITSILLKRCTYHR